MSLSEPFWEGGNPSKLCRHFSANQRIFLTPLSKKKVSLPQEAQRFLPLEAVLLGSARVIFMQFFSTKKLGLPLAVRPEGQLHLLTSPALAL